MHLLPRPNESPLTPFGRLVVLVATYTVIVVLLGFIAPTDYPHQPGDWHRDIRKVFIAVAATWLIWRGSRRSLDRTRPV